MKRIFILTITAFAIANAVFAQTEQKPEMKSDADSVAYLFGVAQSNGLDRYAKQQFGVEPEFFGKFTEGILSRTSANPDDKEAAAYSAGIQIGDQIMKMAQSLQKDYYATDSTKTIDPKIVAQGIVAGLLSKSGITPEAAGEQFRAQLEAQHAAQKEAMYGPNREAGEKWLKANKKKKGVKTLPSGLQYKVITAGTGEIPTDTCKVVVDYEGRLIDGTVFDSSYKRGKPATFGVTQVIKGWTEALQLMPVGSKWELYIPQELAYGDREGGKEIKPWSALVFTVELKGIEK